MDVLDDYIGEAEEVYEHNEWLNYTLPLHRLREMGHHDRVFDLIDERELNRMDLKDFCLLLFGSDNMDGVPDPDIDWEGFITDVKRLLSEEQEYWVSVSSLPKDCHLDFFAFIFSNMFSKMKHPIKKKVKPWINIKKLNSKVRCSIM